MTVGGAYDNGHAHAGHQGIAKTHSATTGVIPNRVAQLLSSYSPQTYLSVLWLSTHIAVDAFASYSGEFVVDYFSFVLK